MAAPGRLPALQEPLLGPDATPGPANLRSRAAAAPRLAARRRAASHGAVESLDYETVVSALYIQKQAQPGERRHLYGYSGSTLTKLIATFLSGILIGLTATALQALVDLVCTHRNRLLDALRRGGGVPLHGALAALQGLPLVFGAMLAISLSAVLASTLAVHCWAPRASGGGVALVMALLNGNAIAGLLSVKVYVAKLLGTAASRLAGLALGVEGPMIHLGSAVASLVCHGEHVLYRRLNLHRRAAGGKLEQAAAALGMAPSAAEDFLFSNSDHRELVSAGAAAGLAAAFGAPIGGVLFALEEATSVWSRKLAWRCFLCASVACFTLAQLHPRSQSGMLSFRGINPLTNLEWLIQMPLLVFVSACGGLLGSAFNIGKRRVLFWRRGHPGISWRLLEGAAVAAITAAALTGLPAAVGTCLDIPEQWDAADCMQYGCPDGQYNDLATGLLSSSVWTIRTLLSMGSDAEPVNNRLCSLATPCYYTVPSLAVLVVAYLALFLAASNLIVPGGLFMPCILIGSAFGVLLGLLGLEVLPSWWDVQPGVYAVVCATAMLGAVFRSSISLVVIVIEGTKGIDLLFGVILATIISNLVAHHLHPDGLYEAELDTKDGSCYYLRQEPPHALRSQTAESVMASPVVGLAPVERVSTVLAVLRSTTHNGFPVLVAGKQQHLLPPDGAAGAGRSFGRMQGFVLRSQLLVLLRHGAFCDERGRYLSHLARHNAAAFEEALGNEMQGAAQAGLGAYRSAAAAGPSCLGLLGPATSLGIGGGSFPSLDASRGAAAMPESAVLDSAADAVAAELEGGRTALLNLAPFMNLAPTTVRPHTPADRVHHLFLALSLRHLCVVDWQSRCLGIITRKDLDHAAGSGWWRATDIAPSPHQLPPGGADSGYEAEGGSPQAGWAGSFVRSLGVPPRRVIEALQQRFSMSPQARSLLQADAPPGEAGGTPPRPPLPGGRTAAGTADGADGGSLLRHSVSEPARVWDRLSQAAADGDSPQPGDVERQ